MSEKKNESKLNEFIENIDSQFINKFIVKECTHIKNLDKIPFLPPKMQYGCLDEDTKCKFVKIFSIPLKKGTYGPFYRYTPNNESNLIADNYLGGYFTDSELSCIKCIKIKLWLYDKERKYFYKDSGGDATLFKYKCYFNILDDMYSTVFIGKVAYGQCLQIRPNNWIMGNDTYNRNSIYYIKDKKNKITTVECPSCKNKNFIDLFEKQ